MLHFELQDNWQQCFCSWPSASWYAMWPTYLTLPLRKHLKAPCLGNPGWFVCLCAVPCQPSGLPLRRASAPSPNSEPGSVRAETSHSYCLFPSSWHLAPGSTHRMQFSSLLSGQPSVKLYQEDMLNTLVIFLSSHEILIPACINCCCYLPFPCLSLCIACLPMK